MRVNLFARKSIDELRAQAFAEEDHGLKRALSATNLVALGIGAIIGTGIFVLTGSAAAQYAGPAIVISFIIAGIGCAFAGLCYSEFASMIPIAGSAYTYGYATLGELIAWIIGWDLILEYLFGAATVAVGWSGYVVSFLRDLGVHVPPQWYNPPGLELVQVPGSDAWVQTTPQLGEQLLSQGINIATLPHATGVFNLVAAVAIGLVSLLLVLGIKESARFNNLAVVVKVSVVLMFILAGGYFLLQNPERAADNWTPFIPPNEGESGPLRLERGAASGGGDLLRVHRIRRGVDHGTGGEESAEGHADRHPRLAGDLHRPLRPRVGHSDGNSAVFDSQRAGTDRGRH